LGRMVTGRPSEDDAEDDEAAAGSSGGVACCTTSFIGGLVAFGVVVEVEGKVARFAEGERRGRRGSGEPAVLESRKSMVGDMARVAIIREAV
jgi:hypothetical protein